LDTIIYMARPRGFQHGIEKLQGTQQVPDVFDIELLIDLFFSIIGMPKSWLFGSQEGGEPPSGKALLAQNMRFLRKVKSLRKPIIDGYTWLAYFHALLRGADVSSLNIRCKMSDISGLEDQMKADIIKTQAEILAMLGDIMIQYNLPKEAWIELVFKKYLHMPDDVVNILVTSLPPEEARPQVPESAAPSEGRLIAEVASRLRSPEGMPLMGKLKRLVREFAYDRQDTYAKLKKPSLILPNTLAEVKTGDRIRLSMAGGEVFRVNVASIADSTGKSVGQKVSLVETADSKPGATPIRVQGKPLIQEGRTEKPTYWEGSETKGGWRRFIKP